MKNGILLVFFMLGSLPSFGQEIGGFEIQDYLIEAEHPTCQMMDAYVTGLPNDSMWANLDNGLQMRGTFGFAWSNGPGDDLVIEAGFDQDVYTIQLVLHDSSLTNP